MGAEAHSGHGAQDSPGGVLPVASALMRTLTPAATRTSLKDTMLSGIGRHIRTNPVRLTHVRFLSPGTGGGGRERPPPGARRGQQLHSVNAPDATDWTLENGYNSTF